MGQQLRQIDRAVARLRRAHGSAPRLAVVLGSGFQGVTSRLRSITETPYRNLPGFVVPQVAGHQGQLLTGRLGSLRVAVLSGRSHYYEGWSMAEVTFPTRVLAAWGVRDLLLTNAAGAIAGRFRPGNFMIFRDHINLMGANPLRGEPWPGQERFVDLTQAYDPALTGMLRRAGRKAKVRLQSGVYLAISGPSYETPAEIRAFERMGADAVGMSTVPEVLVARQCGLRVAALSCLTNLAAGKGKAFLSHADVLALSTRVERGATSLLEQFANLYAAGD